VKGESEGIKIAELGELKGSQFEARRTIKLLFFLSRENHVRRALFVCLYMIVIISCTLYYAMNKHIFTIEISCSM